MTMTTGESAGVTEGLLAATRFRRAMGRVPTGIAVVSMGSGPALHGMTVGSLVHVSNDPPLIAFFADLRSQTLQRIRDRRSFGVSVLGRGDEELCYRFATSQPGQIDADTVAMPSGLARLASAVMWLDCTVDSFFPAGDHLGVMGRVSSYGVPSEATVPLAFYRSKLAALDPSSGRHAPTESLHWW